MKARSANEVLNWLVVLLAFALPLYRSWVTMAAYLILLLWFFQGDLRDRFERLKRHRLSLAVVVFLGLGLLSLLWSEDPVGGLDYWRKYAYLLVIPVVASSLRSGIAHRALIALTTGSVLAVAVMPVVIIADLHFRHTHPGNPAATMSHLDFSMVLAVTAVLLLVHLTYSDLAGRRRLMWTMALVVVIGGLLLNIGRSGQFAFIATLPILLPLLLRRHPVPIRLAAMAAVALTVVVAYLVVPNFHSRVDDAVAELRQAVVEQEINSNQGKRVAGALVASSIYRGDPVLGTGLGGNMPEFRRLLDSDYPQFKQAIGWFPHLHNQYLQTGTELGTAGLVALLAIFIALVAGRYQRPEVRAAAVAIACVYLFGFIGDPFFRKQLPLILFALTAGIVSASDDAFTEKGE